MLAVLETYNCWNVIPERYLSSAVFFIDEACISQCELPLEVTLDKEVIGDNDADIDFEQASLLPITPATPVSSNLQPVDETANRCRELLKSINDFTYVDLPPAVVETLHSGLNQLLDVLRGSVPKEDHPRPSCDAKQKTLPAVKSLQPHTAALFPLPKRKRMLSKRRVNLSARGKRPPGVHRVLSVRKRIKGWLKYSSVPWAVV
jgi:hypothetical protein